MSGETPIRCLISNGILLDDLLFGMEQIAVFSGSCAEGENI